MNTYTRALILTAMTAVSLTQGCSCSSDKDDPVVVEPPVVPEAKIALNGAASKGILMGANVSACTIESLPACATPVATAKTDDKGKYTLSIPKAQEGKPLVVRITPAATGTTMKCDIPDGCGGTIAFGQSYPVAADSGLQLDAVVASASSTVDVNVSVLTDLAAKLAVAGIASGADAAAITKAITDSNSQIANLFGVTGDITAMQVIDLTDPAAVKAAVDGGKSNALMFNSLGAAIAKAVQNDGAGLSIEAAISKFVTAFVAGGLTQNAASAGVTGLNEILARASAVITQAALGAEVSAAELVGAINALAALADAKTPSDEGTKGTPGPVAGSDDIAKVKAFVAVLGDLTTSLNMAVVKEGVTVESRSDAFDMQLQAADMATSDDVDKAVEATAKTAEAFAAAYEAYYDNNELSKHMTGDIKVTITQKAATDTEKASVTLAVKQDVMGVAIDMAAMEMLEHTDPAPVVAEGTTTETDTVKGMVSIMGTAITPTATLRVMDDSIVSADELMSVQTDVDSTEALDVSVKNLMLKLHVKLMQTTTETGADPVTFDGMLSATLESFVGEGETKWVKGVETTTSTQSVTKLDLKLWGSVANTTGDKATLSFNVMGDGSGVELTQDWMEDIANPETDSNFADLSVNVAFMADIAGVANAVTVQYAMNRSMQKAAKANLKLSYPGVQMSFATSIANGDSKPKQLIVTNQDGVVATFAEGDKVMGTFYVAGKKVATSEDAVVTIPGGGEKGMDLIMSLDLLE
ncbi:MAG: hypothetical protein U5M23_01165 [Marinagarivorans sp.]|nr:hypothetical protein [Marinagarivorans sp.]